MAHFAKLDENNIVVDVVVVDNDKESFGSDFLNNLGFTGTWIQTSYNTKGGIHLLGGTPLRKNYAGIGYTYDLERDAFIPPKTFPSWILNEETCLWEPPTSYPEDGNFYEWNEESLSWIPF
jgi:hypothetical protein